MTRPAGGRHSSAPFILVIVPMLSACPAPIARTVTTSAPIVGLVTWADGAPASGLEVVVSPASWDRSCGETLARTRTDSTGSFRLPATHKHYNTTPVFPGLDLAVPRFQLCAAVRDTLRPAYVGTGAFGDGADEDSVACVAWEHAGSFRVSCDGQAAHAVATGGHWLDTSSKTDGFYRVFLTHEPIIDSSRNKRRGREAPFVFVQWVQPRATQGATRYDVRATASLTFDRKKVWSLERALLWRRDGRWMVSLEGIKHAFMDDFARAELVFELGSPGTAKLVARP